MMGLGIVLTLRDKASAGIDLIRQKMAGFTATTQDMVKNFDEGAKSLLTGLASITIGFKTFGVMQKTFAASINTAANFEQAMARVKAVSGATGEDFKALSEQAEQLGRDTQFSASQAANAQELLARAGFKTGQIIASMPGLLDMAAADSLELADAASIVSGTLNGFGISADKVNEVADILAMTSSITDTSISTLGESFKYTSGYAKILGVDIKQVAAMLGVMGDAQIKGSQAGSELSMIMARLSSPPKEAAEALKKLGVSFTDSKGNLLNMQQILEQLSASTKNLSNTEKLTLFKDLAGQYSAKGLVAILDAFDNGKLNEKLQEIEKNASGKAHQMAETMNDTAQGAEKRLESATEGLRIAIGNHLLPVYTKIINKIAEFKSWLTKLIKDHPVLSKAIIGVVTSLATLASAALIAVGTLMSVAGAIKLWGNLKPVISTLFKGILSNIKTAKTALTGMITPVLSFIALAGVMYYAYKKNLGGIRDMFEAISEGFTFALNADDKGIVKIEEDTIERLKKNGNWDNAVNMGMLFYRINEFWKGIKQGATDTIEEIKKALSEAVKWFDDLFTGWFGENNFFSDFLKMFRPESEAKDWKEWGKIIGTAITLFLGLALAIKTVAIALTILNNPLFVILGTIMLLVKYWEKWQSMVEDFWGALGFGKPDASVDELVQEYTNYGYKFDKDNKIIDVPAFMQNDPHKEEIIKDIEAQIAEAQSKAIKPLTQEEVQKIVSKNLTASATSAPDIKDVALAAKIQSAQNWQDNVENSGSLALQSALSANALQQKNSTIKPQISVPAKAPAPVIVTTQSSAPKKADNDEELAKKFLSQGGVNLDEITAEKVLSAGEQQVKNAMTIADGFSIPSLALEQPTPPTVVPFSPTAEVNVTNPFGESVILSINELISSNNVLGGDIKGLTSTLGTFEPEVKVNTSGSREDKAAPILVQRAENQATQNGTATAQAFQNTAENVVKVNNTVDVKISGAPVTVELDGERLNSIMMKLIERHSLREGRGS